MNVYAAAKPGGIIT